jgi:hypothetical protein
LKKIPSILALRPVLASLVKAQTGPDTTPEIVVQAAATSMGIPPGKFQPTWDSLPTN